MRDALGFAANSAPQAQMILEVARGGGEERQATPDATEAAAEGGGAVESVLQRAAEVLADTETVALHLAMMGVRRHHRARRDHALLKVRPDLDRDSPWA